MKLVLTSTAEVPEMMKDSQGLDVNAAGKIKQEVKEINLPVVPELEKLDVRKEPPVPVEPPADALPVIPSAVPEKKEEVLPVEPNKVLECILKFFHKSVKYIN